MGRKALIVVDLQNDFLTGTLSLNDCPAKQDGVKTIPVINRLIEGQDWDLVVYTFDWHPNGHISFVTNAHKFKKHPDSKGNHEKAEVYNELVFEIDGKARSQVMWPPHCIQGSWGAELHKDLKVTKDGCRVYKGLNKEVDSYSAFFDNDKMAETCLRKLLHDQNITSTYVCGVATDVCVNFTAVDSHELGFKTHVIMDGCAGVSEEGISACVGKWKEMGIQVITSEEMVSKCEVDEQQPQVRRSGRMRRPPSRYSDNWQKA